MLIPRDKLEEIFRHFGVTIKGVLHVGAHNCEERSQYAEMGISDTSVVWVEALPEKVKQARDNGIHHILEAVVADENGRDVEFKVTNNVQSSSILNFGVLKRQYPNIDYVRSFAAKTKRLDTLISEAGEEIGGIVNGANMWNFDIQGAELMALKGAGDLIKGAEVLYLEVNREPIYAGCALIDELDAWCDERGFVRVATVWTRAEWGDAVYIRKEFTGGDGAPRNRVETGPPPRRQSPTGRETVSIKPGQILRLS